MARVLISATPFAKVRTGYYEILQAAGHDMVYPSVQRQLSEDEAIEQASGCAAILAGSEPYTERFFTARPEVRVLARAGVGYDAVDVEAATRHGVVVAYAPGSNQEAVAEHTFMLMLSLAKNLLGQDPLIRQGSWPRYANLPLRGQTLGIIGLGRIGKAVAERALAFRMHVLATEPVPDHAFISHHGIALVGLEELLSQADYVTLHCPLTPETHQMINRERLGRMKATAFLINTARGGVVHEPDLAKALREGQIAGAGLDVLNVEPPGPDHPFFALDHVILTAHTAGVDHQSRDMMGLLAAQAISRLSLGEWPEELIVNPQVKPHFRWHS